MKNLIYSSILCTAIMLFGHSAADAQFNIGIRASINIANINDARFDTESITGYAVGAYLNFAIPNTPIGIQPEILYTQKGFQSSTGLEEQAANVTFNLEYIEIPLLAKIRLGSSGAIVPFIYGGTYIGVKINQDVKSSEIDIEVESIKDTDYGYTIGAGFDMGRFVIEGRYDGGIAEISENGKAKNGVITISAALEF